MWDVAGREYIDYHLSSGPALLGHAHPAIIEAVAGAARQGHARTTSSTSPEIALAERLVEAIPCGDVVHYTGSGTEATFYALRIARAFTGRNKILKFEGAWHGMHDYGLWGTVPSDAVRLSARQARLGRRAAADRRDGAGRRRSTRPQPRSR